jgi:Secretion system C-terminal sorting domain
MKKIFIFLFLILPYFSLGQLLQDSLRNRVWITGYDFQPPEFWIEHVIFDFNYDSLVISKKIVENGIVMDYTNSSICDRQGNLLLFTNGCSVGDSTRNKIIELESVNSGIFQDYICENLNANPYSNTSIILPMYPDTIIKIFYIQTTRTPTNNIYGFKLLETRVQRNHLNQITPNYIDKLVILDTIFVGNLSATRHANGRDWWLICPENPLGYYKLLISMDSIIVNKQHIGYPTNNWDDSTGEASFSPDGNKFARYTIRADLQIFDFDRCTGNLTNAIHVPIVDAADTSYAAGLAFSPNNRFLYLSSTKYIYQFDLQSTDIAASRKTVAIYDGFIIGGLSTRFYQCELAPDNKIYVSCPGGKEAVHVIEHPDSLGLACKVIQHKHILPYPIIGGLPNFPNFHLGPLVGSGCDTIAFTETKEVVAGKESGLNFVLYPNPTNDVLTIDLLENINSHSEYIIYNCMGSRVGGDNLTEKTTQIPVGQLPAGIYNVVIRLPERIMAVKRFQIIR